MPIYGGMKPNCPLLWLEIDNPAKTGGSTVIPASFRSLLKLKSKWVDLALRLRKQQANALAFGLLDVDETMERPYWGRLNEKTD